MSLEDKLYPVLSIYERLPIGVRTAIGSLYRILPNGVRRGKHYQEFQNIITTGETWTKEEAWEFQKQQLRKTLRQAAGFCPFYEKRFAEARFSPESIQSPEDMLACPMLTKSDLLEHLPQMVSTAQPASSRLYITTGGSTGVPVGFYLQKGISRPKEQAMLEGMWKRGGFFEGARLALIRGYVTSTKSTGKISSFDATRNWLILSSYHLTLERVPEYLAELERFRPDLLYVYPSSALMLAEYLEAAGLEWKLPLRGILCGSECLTAPQKQMIERTFRCRSFAWYGHSERVVLAAQGRTTDFYYFVPQYGFVEFGPPNADGLREVIGTSFHNMVMPLIRYRTGDYVRLADPAVANEFPWPAASEIAGREQEFLISATGRKISLTAFNMHDRIFDGLYAVQFYQDQPGVAEFRYVRSPRFDDARLGQIEESIQRKLGDDFQFRLQQVADVERTPSGKHKWLVARLNTVE